MTNTILQPKKFSSHCLSPKISSLYKVIAYERQHGLGVYTNNYMVMFHLNPMLKVISPVGSYDKYMTKLLQNKKHVKMANNTTKNPFFPKKHIVIFSSGSNHKQD